MTRSASGSACARCRARPVPPVAPQPQAGGFRSQIARMRGVIEPVASQPHRTPSRGRVSSLEEEALIAEGNFPHVLRVEKETAARP